MLRPNHLAASSALLVACAPGQGPTPTAPPADALQSIATAAVARGYPGIVLAGSIAGGPLYTAAAGVEDRARDTPMTATSLFHGASTTKIFTAAAALLLVEREQLRLDAPVTEYVAAEICDGIPHIDRITVRHLLLHRSGMYSPQKDPRFFAKFGHQFGPDGEHRGFRTPPDLMRTAADPDNPPLFEPGQGQNYNALNYVMLELVLEAASDEALPALVRRLILEPLGLESTYYLSTDRGRPRARGYTVDSPRIRQMGLHPSLRPDADGFVDTTDYQDESNGGSGIIVSMPDQVRFARAAVDGTLLSDASTALLLAVLEKAESGKGGMQLGILRATKTPDGVIALALGNGFGTHAVWAYHPESSAIVAVGINQYGRWTEPNDILGTIVPQALRAVRKP